MPVDIPRSAPQMAESLARHAYLADRGLATAVHLAVELERPLLLEGPTGVGKTEAALALSGVLDRQLIRLQCYEGIDASQALYDWDYTRQLLYARALEPSRTDPELDEIFSERFLVERPLLRALRHGAESVLLIDEIDRADDEFDAFLLEVLSDYQVTIPELGTVRSSSPPVVLLTSNRTRDLHDALRRRCLYHWIDYPDARTEAEIIRRRAPEVPALLADAITTAVRRLRQLDLLRSPGVAEAVDWARAVHVLGHDHLDEEIAALTLGWVIKDHDDTEQARAALPSILSDA